MKLIEITGKLKTKFNPSQIMNSLERAADFYDESDNDSEGDDSAEDLKDNPYGDSVMTRLEILKQ